MVAINLPLPKVLNYGQPVNQSAPLNRGLSLWLLAQPQRIGGIRFLDLCGNYHGAFTNGPTWSGSLGRPGGRASLLFVRSASHYLNFGAIDCNVEFSWAAWIYLNSTGLAQNIFGNFNSGGSNVDYSIRMETDNKFSHIQGGSGFMKSTSTLSGSTWYHLGVVRSGAAGAWTILHYINGVQDRSTGTAFNPDATATNTSLGRTGDFNGNYLDGYVDDVRFYHGRALTASDFAALYNASRTGYQQELNWLRRPWLNAPAAGTAGNPYYYRHLAGAA